MSAVLAIALESFFAHSNFAITDFIYMRQFRTNLHSNIAYPYVLFVFTLAAV